MSKFFTCLFLLFTFSTFSQNTVFLEYDYLFKSRAIATVGETDIYSTHNKSYRLGYMKDFSLSKRENDIVLSAGLVGGVTLVNDIYIFENSGYEIPQGFPSNWSEREFLYDGELVDLGIQLNLEKKFHIGRRFSLAPSIGTRLFSPLFVQDYSTGFFVIPTGRGIRINRDYNNGDNDFSIISSPKLSYHLGFNSEFPFLKNNQNKINIGLLIAKGPKNIEKSTFEALTFDDNLYTSGELNINRNYAGLIVGYTFGKR